MHHSGSLVSHRIITDIKQRLPTQLSPVANHNKALYFKVVDLSCASYFWPPDVTKEDWVEKLWVINLFSTQASFGHHYFIYKALEK